MTITDKTKHVLTSVMLPEVWEAVRNHPEKLDQSNYNRIISDAMRNTADRFEMRNKANQ